MKSLLSRRQVFRGMLNGAAVTIGLPFLNAALNNSGTALASGAPLPVRFGTWFWGVGMNEKAFFPKTVGANYDVPEEIGAIGPVKQHVNIFSNYQLPFDGQPNLCHHTGLCGIRSGVLPFVRALPMAPSLDVLIADAIGGGTRIPSLELAASGDLRDSYSFRDSNTINFAIASPVELYERVFGSEFQDPNSGNFKPDPRIMVRKSVLSAVGDERTQIMGAVGSEDRARLDQYFTAIRELEGRLATQLEKPAPAEACRIPGKAPGEFPKGIDADVLAQRHKIMTDTLVLALACNQTKVFNMCYSNAFAATTLKGQSDTHHGMTHQELVDAKTGYQPTHHLLVMKAMESWAYMVKTLAEYKEGDGTLLERSLVFAHSDTSTAKVHSTQGVPMMTAGSANGRMKTGLHVNGGGAPATNVGFTLQRVMGLPVASWGALSLTTSKEVGEVLV